MYDMSCNLFTNFDSGLRNEIGKTLLNLYK